MSVTERKNELNNLTVQELVALIHSSAPGSPLSSAAIEMLIDRHKTARSELVSGLENVIFSAIPESNRSQAVLQALQTLVDLAERKRV